jgi:hypothetical protein
MTRYRDAWDAVKDHHAHLSPQAQAVLREAYLTVPRDDTPRHTGPNKSGPRYPPNYLHDMQTALLHHLAGGALLTRQELATRVGYSTKYISVALADLVRTNRVHRNNSSPGTPCRYWRAT